MLPHLSFVAEFSKTISVLVVLVLLVLMMAYLSRVSVFPDFIPGSSSSVTWVHQPGISQQTMLLTPNPFQLHIIQEPTSNNEACPENVVRLKASSLSFCQCVCWWGVDLRGLHTILSWPWPAFRDALLSPSRDATPNICLFSERPQLLEGTMDLELKVPNELQETGCLGAPPRIRCPLVVTLIIPSGPQDSNNDSPARVVALVSIVHVKDDLVPMGTGILSQYLKQANGQVTNLQPLYLSGVSNQFQDGEEENSLPPSTSDEERPESICCVVCHCNPASLALLPCRHACLCPHCLPRLTDCPLCRTRISSFFYVVQTRSPPSTEDDRSNESDLKSDSHVTTQTRLRNVVLPS